MWNLYHARDKPGIPQNDPRSPRLQPLAFDTQTGLPILGVPVSTASKLPKPSGTPE